eukprot:scaffold165017_cov39-Tisochrysis_lutea.AAC.2
MGNTYLGVPCPASASDSLAVRLRHSVSLHAAMSAMMLPGLLALASELWRVSPLPPMSYVLCARWAPAAHAPATHSVSRYPSGPLVVCY